jgi:peptidoglycan/LPS O-acetylase OafA/YrhL
VEHGVEGELAPPPAPARAPIGHLREVDALRGVAILLVFLYHCDTVVRPGARGAGPLFAFVRAGHTGVSLFFVLSGFLLSMAFIAEAEGGRHLRRREYALRRAMRILPMYYLALLVALWWSKPIAQWASSWPFLVFLNPLAGPYAL